MYSRMIVIPAAVAASSASRGIRQRERPMRPIHDAPDTQHKVNTRYGPDTNRLLKEIDTVVKSKSTELKIDHLNIRSLPPLPSWLESLSCNNNKLRSLPQLPDGIIELTCQYNFLTSLPELPSGLKSLSCNNNTLTYLPELPSGLESLSCDTNILSSLPELPSGLESLSCANNKITFLPPLPSGLGFLFCVYNIYLTTVTGSCPAKIREEPMVKVFFNCPNLSPKPIENETCGNYFDRASKVQKFKRGVGSRHLVNSSENVSNTSIGGKRKTRRKNQKKRTRKN